MKPLILPRRLTFKVKGEARSIDQSELIQRSEPLVVLGEAGMGKSTLLEQLVEQFGAGKARLVPARRLAASIDPTPLLGDSQVLIIDALDEASGTKEGEAVDRVLARLEYLGNPQFVLACRAADWLSATGVRAIADAYGQAPLQLNLEPLDADDARRLLAHSVGPDRANELVAHFEDRGLEDFFGNPQTLKLVEDVADRGTLPDTRGGLFAQAVNVMWAEHSDRKQDRVLAQLGETAVLDAAGAAFATLILTGKDALSLAARPHLGPEDLPVSEIGDDHVALILESRLFRPLGESRFTYTHRSIGEYLAARWLSRRADSPRKRRRLMALFHHQGLVPANLRGLHAWLAQDVALAKDVIPRDPMGVIEYGDADELDAGQAAMLLGGLVALDERNPAFRGWGNFRARSLLLPQLRTRVAAMMADKATGFRLRTLLLQIVVASGDAHLFAPLLRDILVDRGEVFAARSLAGEALAELGEEDWIELIEKLRSEGSDNGQRLALELLPRAGFDKFSDRMIADVVATRAGLTLCSVQQKHSGQSMVGTFWPLEQKLPDERLEGVLDELAGYARDLLNPEDSLLDRAEITDVVFSLAARRVSLPGVDPLRLWSWLAPFESETGYHRPPREKLAEWFRANPDARRAIQRHVLLDQASNKNMWQLQWRLARVFPGLAPDESDVVELLALLGSPTRPTEQEVELWRSLVQLVPHDAERGEVVREAASAFAGKRKRLQAWLTRIATPSVPKWQVAQEKRRAKRDREREERWAEHRADFRKNAKKLRAGQFGYVLPVAQAYLKLFSDMGDDIPAHERVAEWLGPELQADAFAGFDAFLTATPPKPTALEIAESHAESRRWTAEYVIVAALAERLRTGSISDLDDDRLIAGALILQQTRLDSHAQIEGLAEAIRHELIRREGKWEAYWRLQIEPQLAARISHVDGLYELMRGEENSELATRLAIEWLPAYPNLAAEPETEMIDRLIASGKRDELRTIARARRSSGISDEERRRNWDATLFFVDFDNAITWLEGAGERDPQLLWHLRRRLNRRFEEDNEHSPQPEMSAAQLAWIIREFRGSWPEKVRPSSVTTGDTNVWDASEFIRRTIARLGGDTSDAAVEALAALRDAPSDGYTEMLAIVAAEQAQKRVEEFYTPPTTAHIAGVVGDKQPASTTDLRAIVLEELDSLAARLIGAETDIWRFFWSGRQPLQENAARDLLVELLGPNLPFGIVAATEVDMPSGKRADIGFSYGQIRLPVEVKCQWHADLWHAADTQLDRLYGLDHRATGVGVYLVLWFGTGSDKSIPRRPGGRPQPASAEELEEALMDESEAAKSGRVVILTLDVSRRSP